MRMLKMACTVLVAILTLSLIASCAAGNDVKEVLDNTLDGQAVKYISLRINPEIELLADENDVVIDASPLNEDGEVVLSTVELEGKTVEDACVEFTETATDLGYLNPDGEKDTVYIDVESSVEGDDNALEEKLGKCITDYFKNKGVNGKVSHDTLEKYAQKAAEWGVSTGHTKLIMRALEANPELTDTDILGMSTREIMKLIKNREDGKDKDSSAKKDELKEEIEQIKMEYSELFDICKEIKELKDSLHGDLSEEEAEAIKAKIAEKTAALKLLKDEYKGKVDNCKENYHKNANGNCNGECVRDDCTETGKHLYDEECLSECESKENCNKEDCPEKENCNKEECTEPGKGDGACTKNNGECDESCEENSCQSGNGNCSSGKHNKGNGKNGCN